MNLRKIARRFFPTMERSPGAAGRKLAHKIAWDCTHPDQPTVLAAKRSNFAKDLEELRQRTMVNWATISAVKIKKYQQQWVPEGDQQQTYFSATLRNGPAYMRERLVEFGTAFLKEASRTHSVDAVMAANVDYWQDEALRLACRELNIPFLVLCRENYTIPWTVPWLHNRFADAEFRFDGAGVACFSEATKRAIMPGIHDPDDIWITGAPRYDRWLDLRPLPADQKNHISLITFNQPGYGAQDVFAQVLRTFAEAAGKHRQAQLNWLVKCKKRADLEEVRGQVAPDLLSGLQFSYDTPLFDLFPKTRLAIGYNSLALVEAMLADVPIAMPWWGQTRPAQSDLLLDPDDPSVSAVMHLAETPEELAKLMARAAFGEDLCKGTAEQRRDVFSRHLHVPKNGHASCEVETFVRHYIDRSRRQGMTSQGMTFQSVGR